MLARNRRQNLRNQQNQNNPLSPPPGPSRLSWGTVPDNIGWVINLILGILTYALFLSTQSALQEARKANNISNKMAEQALKANEIAQQNLNFSELQYYRDAPKLKITDFDVTEENKKYYFSFQLENMGQRELRTKGKMYTLNQKKQYLRESIVIEWETILPHQNLPLGPIVFEKENNIETVGNSIVFLLDYVDVESNDTLIFLEGMTYNKDFGFRKMFQFEIDSAFSFINKMRDLEIHSLEEQINYNNKKAKYYEKQNEYYDSLFKSYKTFTDKYIDSLKARNIPIPKDLKKLKEFLDTSGK